MRKMSYDFYAEIINENKVLIENKISGNDSGKKREKRILRTLPDCFNSLYGNWYTNLQCISLFTKYYESGNDNKKEDIKAGYRGYLQTLDVYKMNSNWILKNNGKYSSNLWKLLEKPKIDVNQLPPHSFFLSIEFTLKKPFISRDDEDFYIIDNPISKEKVFKIPYIRASSWKGNLRWVARKLFNNTIDGNKEIQLFGNEKTEENKFNRGRLRFYPTFFNRIGLDIINPHNRETKAGTVPIYFEIVPEKTQVPKKAKVPEKTQAPEKIQAPEKTLGEFSLLYVPFDLIGEDEITVMKEVRNDFTIVLKSIYKLLVYYGFSAKKSSGYGVIDINEEFRFNIIDEKIEYLELRNKSGNFIKFDELLEELGGMNND